MKAKATDEQIINAWPVYPSVTKIAARFGMSSRQMNVRITDLRNKGATLPSNDPRSPFFNKVIKPVIPQIKFTRYDARVEIKLKDGVILVGSDSHYWPGEITTAHRGFVRFIKEMNPSIVVMNGDIFDGARVSRYARIGWDKRPTVLDELRACKERLAEIEKAAGKAKKYWPLGNHDSRFETRLAQLAPEFEGVQNFHLKDHFPNWTPCWSLMVNENLVIKHRWKGGIYAPRNNALQSGVSYVTGHLHSLKWWPHSDETGTRYGVDTGCLAEPEGRQFLDYTEDSPKDWRSGFAILSIVDGVLLQPEVAKVHDEGRIDFRGTLVNV